MDIKNAYLARYNTSPECAVLRSLGGDPEAVFEASEAEFTATKDFFAECGWPGMVAEHMAADVHYSIRKAIVTAFFDKLDADTVARLSSALEITDGTLTILEDISYNDNTLTFEWETVHKATLTSPALEQNTTQRVTNRPQATSFKNRDVKTAFETKYGPLVKCRESAYLSLLGGSAESIIDDLQQDYDRAIGFGTGTMFREHPDPEAYADRAHNSILRAIEASYFGSISRPTALAVVKALSLLPLGRITIYDNMSYNKSEFAYLWSFANNDDL